MPPFADEREEKQSCKKPFLSLRSHDPVRPTNSGITGPFGAEPSEGSAKQGPCGSTRPSSSASSRQPPTHPVLWGSEPEENDEQTTRSGESEGSSGESETVYQGTSKSVFSIGWHSLMDMKKVSFWKENMDDDQVSKKKRKYNNMGRAANASYLRKNHAGQFKQNGVDPGRIQRLFQADSCQCSLFSQLHHGF